ncbi:MAG: flagellar basal body rod protein FlgC [Planctomycetota bacterium]|jgi:flagellar basal-body rod protein FlgC|nr:flagellar basal body rod protein FlgC [Planctomycetota bacterium]
MPIQKLFAGIDAASSALGAERLRITAASENLAHAGSTKKLENGLPYARQRVVFEEVLDARGQATGAVRAEVVDSPRYFERYDPNHPDADPETGIVVESEINPVLELTDLTIATRAYEANTNAIKGMMRLHEQALRLGEV